MTGRLVAYQFRRAAEAVLAAAIWGLVWGPWLVGVVVIVAAVLGR